MKTVAKTKEALKIIDKLIGPDEELRQMVEDEKFNAAVAQLIYGARTRAGLTQRELAERIGSKQPVIARLEDADYQGHSLSMLNRIAQALDSKLVLQMVNGEGKRTQTARQKRVHTAQRKGA